MALAVHGALLLTVLNMRAEPGLAPPPPMQVELTPAIAFEPPPPRAAPTPPHTAPASEAIPAAPPLAPPAPSREPAKPSEAVTEALTPRPVATAPAAIEARAMSPVAPAAQPFAASAAPPAPSNDAAVLASFQGRVMARLAQVKRYPPAARARREQGVAAVRFTLTGEGRVRTVALDRSSGSSLLDREALETVRRAQPLPRIPDELSDPLLLTVAVEFVLP